MTFLENRFMSGFIDFTVSVKVISFVLFVNGFQRSGSVLLNPEDDRWFLWDEEGCGYVWGHV